MAGSRISKITPDTVTIRGYSLTDDLIGQVGFIDMILLQMLGERSGTTKTQLVEAVMVAIMEHGLVPSVLAARLTLHGAPESLQGAVAAGLLGVGDRYAGTGAECASVLDRIVAANPKDRPSTAASLVADYKARGRPLPGFGHPNHKQGDPRYHRLIAVARTTDTAGDYLDACDLLAQALAESAGKSIPTNISLAIGALLREADLPIGIIRGIVLIARSAGLVGHLAEEMTDPSGHVIWTAAEEAMAEALEP